MKLVIASVLVTVLPFAIAQADRSRGGGDRPHLPHHPPPQEAIDACAKAARGDACSFTMHDHTITGTCDAPPDKTVLACRPDHPPLPPEAIEACANKRAGDACSFTFDGHDLAGNCATGPDGNGPLACRPSR